MRVYFDTEFIEDGRTVDLISIGLVREDGATYYAESAEADLSRASDWVRENVFPSLDGHGSKPRAIIADEIRAFVGPEPEFWAYYADYDWVALCQLYGRMIDLPDGWPMYCRDLKQLADDEGTPINQEGSVHNALGDAQWVRDTHANLLRPEPTAATRCTHPGCSAELVNGYWGDRLAHEKDGTHTVVTFDPRWAPSGAEIRDAAEPTDSGGRS